MTYLNGLSVEFMIALNRKLIEVSTASQGQLNHVLNNTENMILKKYVQKKLDNKEY